jgi:hypothetical protein
MIAWACGELGALLYSQALEKVVPVNSTRAAEMVKLLENTLRMINIGLVNEIALMWNRININDVPEISSTRYHPLAVEARGQLWRSFRPEASRGWHVTRVDGRNRPGKPRRRIGLCDDRHRSQGS